MTFCETSMLSCFVSDRFFSEGERDVLRVVDISMQIMS